MGFRHYFFDKDRVGRSPMGPLLKPWSPVRIRAEVEAGELPGQSEQSAPPEVAYASSSTLHGAERQRAEIKRAQDYSPSRGSAMGSLPCLS